MAAPKPAWHIGPATAAMAQRSSARWTPKPPATAKSTSAPSRPGTSFLGAEWIGGSARSMAALSRDTELGQTGPNGGASAWRGTCAPGIVAGSRLPPTSAVISVALRPTRFPPAIRRQHGGRGAVASSARAAFCDRLGRFGRLLDQIVGLLGQRFLGSNHIRPPRRVCKTMCG